MNAKLLKRILYGLVGAAFLFVGGREALAAGLNFESVAGLAAGVVFAFMGVTGAG